VPSADQINHLLAAAATALDATGHAHAAEIAFHLRKLGSAQTRKIPAPGDIPALAHLPAVLAAGAANPVIRAMNDIASDLPWVVGDWNMPESAYGHYAYVDLVGPAGLVPSAEIGFGLFLQAPNTFYPPHNHAAEEIYFALSGTGQWQKGAGAFQARPPGSLMHHLPWQFHAMRTGGEPMLLTWSWSGDLDPETYAFGEAQD
jgi:mannose-6-phosphate isomerase-like protein (cupin superfamily)